ncbi:hypothetical protein GF407_04770, partial [candidate division KSB1 bacterium]|nr:hypothetical protein [candidate division KSB1 bacterium]
MKAFIFFFLIFCVLITGGFTQLLIKNASTLTLFKVTSLGKVGISIGDAAPAATLDVGGDVHIGTVNDLAGTGNASVLVLDNGLVMKRTLLEEIWDGDDGESYTAGTGISISTSNVISAADPDPLNETPQSGTATSVSGRVVDVVYDNSTIKVNGSNQLYVDQLPASAGWTFYNAQQMLIECAGTCASNQFFRWYSRSELGIPSTAQAVYVHTALADDGGNNYNLTVTELS